jgi:hypothetical protein
MPNRVHIRVLRMDNSQDVDFYETVKQDVLVDGGKRYEVHRENHNWDKTGVMSVFLEYIEKTGDDERF